MFTKNNIKGTLTLYRCTVGTVRSLCSYTVGTICTCICICSCTVGSVGTLYRFRRFIHFTYTVDPLCRYTVGTVCTCTVGTLYICTVGTVCTDCRCTVGTIGTLCVCT